MSKEAVLMDKLAEPFPASAIQWKAQATTQDKSKALAVAYLDARAVAQRLDDVVGSFGWQVTHRQEGERLVTALAIRNPENGEWVTKEDVGYTAPSERDAGIEVKGTVSDGLKRAAVLWGIGRYLYSLDGVWVAYDAQRKQLLTVPALPNWALPSGESPQQVAAPPQPQAQAPAPTPSEPQAIVVDAAALEWLGKLRQQVQAKNAQYPEPREPSSKMTGFAAVLLGKCWPEISDRDAQDARRHQFCELALGKRLSEMTYNETKGLIDALTMGEQDLHEFAAIHVRELVLQAAEIAAEMPAAHDIWSE